MLGVRRDKLRGYNRQVGGLRRGQRTQPGVRVFISYSTALDQIIALRLQTVAAVYGMTVYVPPASTRRSDTPQLPEEVIDQLKHADVVLAVITQQPAQSTVSEMNLALGFRRLLIPIVSPGVPPQFYAEFKPHFVVNPADPSTTEQEIVSYLANKQQAEAGKTAIFALAIFAVALLLLGGGDSK